MEMCLNLFTKDENFPFFIHYGQHETNLVMHTHADFFEMTIVLEGSSDHLVDNERFHITKGDVFVMGHNVSHGYDNPIDFRICNIMFRPELIKKLGDDLMELPGFHALFLVEPVFNNAQGFKNRLRLTTDNFIEVRKLIASCIDAYNSSTPGKNTLAFAYFTELAVLLSRLYECTDDNKEIDSMANAVSYLESNYKNDIKISNLIDLSNYSERHFMRLFVKTFGLTPNNYLQGIRIRHACRMLKESEMSITDIAYECGFDDANYFSRLFKKKMGVTPSRYR